jgi:hypothetical protein
MRVLVSRQSFPHLWKKLWKTGVSVETRAGAQGENEPKMPVSWMK